MLFAEYSPTDIQVQERSNNSSNAIVTPTPNDWHRIRISMYMIDEADIVYLDR
jgi:hypothetical protein